MLEQQKDTKKSKEIILTTSGISESSFLFWKQATAELGSEIVSSAG
jgi:hypothetical protein